MANFVFTHTEQTVRRHNVGFIAKQVKDVLDLKRIKGICMNKMPRDEGQLYTTREASKIIDDIVWDSVYHSPRNHG